MLSPLWTTGADQWRHEYGTYYVTVDGRATTVACGSLHVPTIVATCSCGWRGERHEDSLAGQAAALQQWRDAHSNLDANKALTPHTW
jgi:hypothetical protein